MRRREFLGLMGGAVAHPLVAHAQQSIQIPRVGYVFSFIASQGEHLWHACRQGVKELGYIEGQNIALEPRWAEGRHNRLPAIVEELIREKTDVIVTAATPASLAAAAATNSIPIVIVAVADPTRVGLVASLKRPGGNVTGLSLLTPELSGKRLQIVAGLVKSISEAAVLTNPDNPSHEVFLEETTVAGQQMGIRIHSLRARSAQEIEVAFQETAQRRIQAAIVFDDPVTWSHRKQVVTLAAKSRLPVMYGYSEFVPEGGLISYGPHRPDLYRRTAGYVDKILKGTRPADLPIERPTKFELFVNLKAAGALGIELPPALLATADLVIE